MVLSLCTLQSVPITIPNTYHGLSVSPIQLTEHPYLFILAVLNNLKLYESVLTARIVCPLISMRCFNPITLYSITIVVKTLVVIFIDLKTFLAVYFHRYKQFYYPTWFDLLIRFVRFVELKNYVSAFIMA